MYSFLHRFLERVLYESLKNPKSRKYLLKKELDPVFFKWSFEGMFLRRIRYKNYVASFNNLIKTILEIVILSSSKML